MLLIVYDTISSIFQVIKYIEQGKGKSVCLFEMFPSPPKGYAGEVSRGYSILDFEISRTWKLNWPRGLNIDY